MISRRSAAVLLLVLAGVGSSRARAPWVLRPNGIGPVKVGMTVAELNTALHEKFALPAEKDSQACFYLKPKGHPQVAFMMEEGRLTRVDVNARGVGTVEGLQVGDSEDRVRQVYGSKAKVEPHKYNEQGHYLTVTSEDGHDGLRFETNQGKIERFYAGKFSAVQYVEGCS